MGIKENLQAFLDPNFPGYLGFPETIENPGLLGVSWGNAIGPEIDLFLLPSAPAGLNASLAGSTFLSVISADQTAFGPLGDFQSALDNALDSAVSAVIATIPSAPPPVPPPPFDSAKTIFLRHQIRMGGNKCGKMGR